MGSSADEIYVLGKQVRLRQPEKGFRTSIDAVLLAASCPVKKSQRVLDLGCGVGAVGFCLLKRVDGIEVTGIDIHGPYLDLAQENIVLNGAEGRISFVRSDVRGFKVADKDLRFDHVVCNPPYLEAGQFIPSPDQALAKARGHDEKELSLKDWVDTAFENLKPSGSLSVVHRADNVDRIVTAMGKRFGAVEIFPLWPKAGEDAKRVVVRAIKDRRSPAVIHAGLVMHADDGEYTDAAENVLRAAQVLF